MDWKPISYVRDIKQDVKEFAVFFAGVAVLVVSVIAIARACVLGD